MTTAHVLITRFNLPTAGTEQMIRAQGGWLAERVQLFQRYTVPSVQQQTVPVAWIVYIDPQSPAWLLERLRPWVASGLMMTVAREVVDKPTLVADVTRILPAGTTRVLTTNLDNDDGLASDFSSRLRRAAEPGGAAAIFADHGLVLHSGSAYLRTDSANAFRSVVSDVPVTVTCWEDWHNRLHLHMPVRHLGGDPAWLQVVHGRNVSNRVRGRLVSPVAYRELFPDLLDDATTPSSLALARDLCLERPMRILRDAFRTGVRRAGVGLLGPSGFNQLKGTVASAARRGG